jgi:L-rhamnose mutarotase
MTRRIAFVLRVRPDKVRQYVEAHAKVWPEMLAALRTAGFRNYSIFRYENLMFGYYEVDDPDLTAELIAADPVNARWQDEMGALLEVRVDDKGPSPLEEVFRLD